MADSLKVLGQIAAAATTVETLYATPSLTQTTVSTLVVCNRTSGTLTFRVSVHVAGADTGTPDNKQYVFYDVPLGGNSTLTLTIGMTLNESDVVQTFASASGLTFNLFGAETSS
jgi:hypothetical protein